MSRKKSTEKKSSVAVPHIKVKKLKYRNDKQKEYIEYLENIEESPVTFSIGPAGTGKTFLACYVAMRKLALGEIRRVILTRPAVEADESLGYLPGSLEEKLDPYMRPLYDSINDLIGFQSGKQLLGDKVIEIVPLAYMRGRTLNGAFVILDEAQNTTVGQMKMFLTRMGNSSTFAINGDITQIDLHESESGLLDAFKKLRNIDGVNWVQFTKEDVVRHWVVKNILTKYEQEK